MFLDLQLYSISIPTTFSPKLISSVPAVNSSPNSLSTPVSLTGAITVVSVAISRLPQVSRPVLPTSLVPKVSTGSKTSLPVQVCSCEFQKLAAIPPFSPSTPRRLAIPLNTESILTTSGVSNAISSIQKSVAGVISIVPLY